MQLLLNIISKEYSVVMHESVFFFVTECGRCRPFTIEILWL